jgi:tetratricopeptide (TPR) repeat protein
LWEQESWAAPSSFSENNNAVLDSVVLVMKMHLIANQGFILLKLEPYREAIKSFKQGLKINPHYPDIYYSIACSYTLTNNIKQAMKALEKAISIILNTEKEQN